MGFAVKIYKNEKEKPQLLDLFADLLKTFEILNKKVL
jgi:hypothetical protein